MKSWDKENMQGHSPCAATKIIKPKVREIIGECLTCGLFLCVMAGFMFVEKLQELARK